jgi:hypothetical protein
VLPDKQDEAAFNDVYIVKGDPANDVIRAAPRLRKRIPSSWRTTDGAARRRQDHRLLHAVKSVCVQASRTSWPVRDPKYRPHMQVVPMKSSRPPTSDCGCAAPRSFMA